MFNSRQVFLCVKQLTSQYDVLQLDCGFIKWCEINVVISGLVNWTVMKTSKLTLTPKNIDGPTVNTLPHVEHV